MQRHQYNDREEKKTSLLVFNLNTKFKPSLHDFCSLIPCILLVFGFLFCFYPTMIGNFAIQSVFFRNGFSVNLFIFPLVMLNVFLPGISG